MSNKTSQQPKHLKRASVTLSVSMDIDTENPEDATGMLIHILRCIEINHQNLDFKYKSDLSWQPITKK